VSRKMLLVTNLDVWLLSNKVRIPGAGNQSLYNTLLGYANAGYDIHMLTTSMVLKDVGPIHQRVHIHRMPLRLVDFAVTVSGFLNRLLPWRRRHPRAGGALRMEVSRNYFIYSRYFRRVMSRRAVKLARQLGGVDLIYGHEVQGALAGEAAAKALGVPLITRFQGTELSRFLDRPQEILKFKTRVAALRADADLVIMSNDGTQGDKVLDFAGVPRERYRFLMNGVVKDDVYRPGVDAAAIRRKLGIPDGHSFVLYTGRMFPWKRVDRLLRVVRRASEQFDAFTTVIIGDGADMEGSQALARELDLGKRVIFTGAMAHSEVMDYLNACDVYVSFHDLTNLCNPAIEACVCGKCIVSTAAGGTTDLLSDNVNAVVVPDKDDEEAMTAALVEVLRNPQKRAALARGAFERGKSLKTWEERMKQEIAEVEAVLEKKRR